MNPTNLNILYEDNYIIVCVKPHGIATQNQRVGTPDMVSLLKNHISRTTPQGKEPYLAVIHRLDQPVTGILVFAKTPFAAKELNQQLTTKGFGKYYRALISSAHLPEEGTLENYLVKDTKTNTSRVCAKDTPNAKIARLNYKIIREGQGNFNWGRSFFEKTPSPIEPLEVEIKLDTGRHHQIRVQFAHIGCPLIGDTKYNPNAQITGQWQQICLCAYKLDFIHPKTKKSMHFQIDSL